MTLEERRQPEIINGSRRLRIANGSGTTTGEVNRLVKQFQEMQKLMKRMGGLGTKSTKKGKRRRMPALPPLAYPGSTSRAPGTDRRADKTDGSEAPPRAGGQDQAAELPGGGRRRRSPRDGRFIEIVGQYNPRSEPSVVTIDNDKALKWLRQGAQPTERVQKLLEISGAWAEFKQ